ncbi:WASH complex subunit 7 family protein [Leishmania donovani]|uniref:WASH complex subunit 7 family protein n=2 Tax=Leishmania donovani TaxID=5661 RepID=A0A504XYL6_LEIDO|nr:WASH complex subunit 7 family protein [Leishmania donovani]
MPACLAYYTGAMCFTIIHFLAWAFAFVATPTAQFQTPGHGCYTMWGYRQFCGNVPYDLTGDAAFGCARRTSTMRCGAAFGVMASVCGFAGLVSAIVLNTQIQFPVIVPFVLAAVCIPCTMISWACVASVYNLTMCGDRFGSKYPYTAGFALMVASWGLELIAANARGTIYVIDRIRRIGYLLRLHKPTAAFPAASPTPQQPSLPQQTQLMQLKQMTANTPHPSMASMASQVTPLDTEESTRQIQRQDRTTASTGTTAADNDRLTASSAHSVASVPTDAVDPPSMHCSSIIESGMRQSIHFCLLPPRHCWLEELYLTLRMPRPVAYADAGAPLLPLLTSLFPHRRAAHVAAPLLRDNPSSTAAARSRMLYLEVEQEDLVLILRQMDSFYSNQVRREEARALRAQLSAFVDHHEQQLFDAQQRLRHPTDATHWSRQHDVVTVQLADTPYHASFSAHHQPRQRRAYQQSSIADLLGSTMASTDPLLFRLLVSLASSNAEMQALSDEARRCYAPPLALVGDDNENCYKSRSTDRVKGLGSDGSSGDTRRGGHPAMNAGGDNGPSSLQHPQLRRQQEQEDILEEEKLLHSTWALLPLLQDIWLWRQRVQDVVAHALFQLASIYHDTRSKGSRGDPPPLLHVRLTSFWDSLSDLLGAVLLVEEVLHQNASIRDGVEVMQRLLAQQQLDAKRDDVTGGDDDGEMMRLLLQKLQADILDSSLLASVAAQRFDQLFEASLAACEQSESRPTASVPSTQRHATAARTAATPHPPPFREHTSLCEEFIAVLTGRCNDFEATLSSPRALEHKSSLAALCGLCYLMKGLFLSSLPARGGPAAGPTSVASTTVSRLVAAMLGHVSQRFVAWQSVVPLLQLQGLYVLCPLLWWRRAFPSELSAAAGAMKDGAGALVRRTVVEACQTSGSQFLSNISQWTQQVDRWAAVEMQSALPIDAPLCRSFIQRMVLLIQQGVALSRSVQDGVVQLLLLHHHAEAPLTVSMVHGVLQGVLLLQRIADAYHSKMGILATAQAALVQSIVYVLEKHLYNLFTRTCSTRPGTAAVPTAVAQEQLLALQGALQLLHKPFTADTLACLVLLLDVALNREELQQSKASPAITEQERDDAFIALAQLKAILTYQQTLPCITSASFLFFHRETLYPLFLKYCYEHTLAAVSLPQIVSALGDCRLLIMSARHVKNPSETLLSDYVEFVRDCVHKELVQPLCTEIENQLRLRTHDAVLGQPYRVLRPSAEASGRDLTRYTLLQPFRFFDEWMHVAAQIEHYLSTQFYNLNALMPNDWKTYEEMRSLALRTYRLRIADSHLPSCILDQGLDVLVITENIQQFVAYYTYNLNEQIFIQRPSLTPSKHLHTLNTRHIANSIRTHGTGVMNTAVNYVYKYLLKKMAILSHFLHDDYVRSHLLKDARAVRQRKKEQQPCKYPVEQAEQLIREMDRLGVAHDGVSFLEKARQLISEMGNALGFMRMMRSGGLRASGDDTDDEEGEEEGTQDGSDNGDSDTVQQRQLNLRRSTVDAVSNLDRVVHSMLEQLSDGSQYYPLLLDAIGRRLRRSSAERYAHLQLLYLLVPALANLQVAYTIQEKEKLLKKHKEEGVFSDDGFAVGTTFLLVLFRAYEFFDDLHWFENKKAQYRGRLEALQAALSTATASGSPEFDNLHLTSSTLHTYLKEYTGLENAFTSSRRFFDTASSSSSSASAAAARPTASDASRRRHAQEASDEEDEQESGE